MPNLTLKEIYLKSAIEQYIDYLEGLFGEEEVEDTTLNDYIWFERDEIYEALGLDENGELPKEDEDDDDF